MQEDEGEGEGPVEGPEADPQAVQDHQQVPGHQEERIDVRRDHLPAWRLREHKPDDDVDIFMMMMLMALNQFEEQRPADNPAVNNASSCPENIQNNQNQTAPHCELAGFPGLVV